MRFPILSPTLLLLTAFLPLASVPAATVIWNGGGSDDSWNTALNWNADAVPATVTPFDDVQFAGPTTTTVDISTNVTVQTLKFNPSTAAFTLGGAGGITLTGTGGGHDSGAHFRNESSFLQTIGNNVTFAGTSIGLHALNGDITFNGNVNMGTTANVRYLIATGRTLTFNGILSGAVGSTMAFNNGGTVVLANANTYTNSTSIWSATARATVDSLNGVAGAFGNSSSAILMGTTYDGGALTARLFAGNAITIGRNITLASPHANQAANPHSYTIGGDTAQTSNFSGTITTSNDSGNKAASKLTVTAATGGRVNIANIVRHANSVGTADDVVKTGAGIVAITGVNNNWQGNTLVQAGTLLINGTVLISPSGKNTQVSGGATLGGMGTLTRDVTLAASAILSPGDMGVGGTSLGGKLTIGGALSLDNASILNFNLASASSLVDDEVFVAGNFSLGGVLNVTNLGGFGNGNYKLFDYGGILDFTVGDVTFGALPAGFTYVLDTTSTANSVFLVVTPEPGRFLLLALGLSTLLMRRRRR